MATPPAAAQAFLAPGPTAAVNNAQVQRQSVTVLLRDPAGTQLGSGVVVGLATGGYWLVSNRHVVQDQQAVCVVTADRQSSAALVIPGNPMARRNELDLSLLWLPRSSQQPLPVATLALKSEDAVALPLVTATGYPTPLQTKPENPLYTERDGLLLPLLSQPLQGGFSLAYTATVEKGMSGGGLFSGTELIGINGAHANPLWPGRWHDVNGRPVSASVEREAGAGVARHLGSDDPGSAQCSRDPLRCGLERPHCRCLQGSPQASIGWRGRSRMSFPVGVDTGSSNT